MVRNIHPSSAAPSAGARWRRWCFGAHPSRTVLRAALWAVVLYLIFGLAIRPVRLRGTSMEPTLADGSWRFVNLLAYRRRGPARGDIVVIRIAGTRLMYLKRVLALPGERIEFRDGVLWVNDAPVDEPYVRQPGRWNTAAYQLGDDEYYVAGDNRSGPYREHATGVVRRRDIAGKLIP